MKTEIKGGFIPNIDTANEEIDRLNARIKDLESKPTGTEQRKPAQAASVTQPVVHEVKLTGLARAQAANIKQQSAKK
jgi:hypothetical protein